MDEKLMKIKERDVKSCKLEEFTRIKHQSVKKDVD